MKRLSFRRGVMMASALAVVATPAIQAIQAAPAGAIQSTGIVVASAGSDTTEGLMKVIMGLDNNTTIALQGSATTATVHTYNIPTNPTGFVVEGEGQGAATDCPSDVTWNSGTATNVEGTAPNGSGAGAKYLLAEHGGTPPGGHAGCIDVGRSSGGPGQSGADPSSFQYFAYGMDAVAWATTSLKAPATLTTAQLQGIYKCTITNWKDVGGTDGPIQRYLPNPGSGTRKFFLTDVLQLSVDNVNPPSAGTFNENASANCPIVKGDDNTFIHSTFPTVMEENQAVTMDPADVDRAILPFSTGRWVFQSQNSINPTLDLRNGARIGGTITNPSACGGCTPRNNSTVMYSAIDGSYQLNTAAIEGANGSSIEGVVDEAAVKAENGNIAESGGTYPGIRFIYNILDSQGNLRGYQAAVSLYGFDNQAPGTSLFKSKLCNNGYKTKIQSAGFAPLNTSGGGSHNLAATTCRLLP